MPGSVAHWCGGGGVTPLPTHLHFEHWLVPWHSQGKDGVIGIAPPPQAKGKGKGDLPLCPLSGPDNRSSLLGLLTL